MVYHWSSGAYFDAVISVADAAVRATMSEDEFQASFVKPAGQAPFVALLKTAAQHLSTVFPDQKAVYDRAVG